MALNKNDIVVMMFAYRYAIGRQTYAPGLVCDYIADKIPEMSQDQKELVMFEVQNSLKHEEYADDIAKDHMEQLLSRLQAFKSA